jgi:hypothetical protein
MDTQEGKEVIDYEVREEDFQQVKMVFMWDKRNGKPNMHKEFDCLWQGPYKIEKKSANDSFYLSTMEGRRMILPISGSLLKPCHGEET